MCNIGYGSYKKYRRQERTALQMWCTSMIGGGCEHLSKNFVSFAASIAQIARGEKSHTQLITHSLSHSLTQLIWCAGNWSFRFEKLDNSSTDKTNTRWLPQTELHRCHKITSSVLLQHVALLAVQSAVIGYCNDSKFLCLPVCLSVLRYRQKLGSCGLHH